MDFITADKRLIAAWAILEACPLTASQPKLLGWTLELWLADPTYQLGIKTRAGAFTNLPHPWQGGFHDSGIRPIERQS